MSEHAGMKHRGTTTYFKVYAALVHAAECRGLVTYQEIAQIMGLPMSGNFMGSEVGRMIGMISEDEVRLGRPMLSAIVVSTAGKPTGGFYSWARDLGRFEGEGIEAQERFWQQEREAVYEAWKKKFKA